MADDTFTLITILRIDPEDLDALLALLANIRDTVLVDIPGHLGAMIHVSLDRSIVHLTGEWRSREDLNAILFEEQIIKHFDPVIEIAKSHETHFFKRVIP